MFISLEKKYVGYPDYRALRNKSHCSWDKIRFLSTGNPFDLKCGVCLIQYIDELSILPTDMLVFRVLIIHGSKLNHYLQPLKYMQITEMCKCKWVFYFQKFLFKAIFKYWQILIDAWPKRKLIFFKDQNKNKFLICQGSSANSKLQDLIIFFLIYFSFFFFGLMF